MLSSSNASRAPIASSLRSSRSFTLAASSPQQSRHQIFLELRRDIKTIPHLPLGVTLSADQQVWFSLYFSTRLFCLFDVIGQNPDFGREFLPARQLWRSQIADGQGV